MKQVSTAKLINLYMSMFSHHKRQEISEEAREWWFFWISLESRTGKFLRFLTGTFLFYWFYKLLEVLLLKGIGEHFLTRKQWIHAKASKFCELNGDVMVFGAGLDPLPILLAKNNLDCTVSEYDLPDASAFKNHWVRKRITPPVNWSTQSINLAKNDLTELAENHAQKTLWVFEGVVMYIPFENFANILEAFKKLPLGSEMVFGFMNELPNGRPGWTQVGTNWLLDLWLASQKEPMLWGRSLENMQKYLSQNGFEVLEVLDSTTVNPKAAHGEYYISIKVNQSD